MVRCNYIACCGNSARGHSLTLTVLGKSYALTNAIRKLLLRSRLSTHSPLLKKGPRQRQSELQTRITEFFILKESRQPKSSGEPGSSASDQGSISPVLEHHLVTKIQTSFLQIPCGLLRKQVISVTKMLLRGLNTEHPCLSGCLAGDVAKNHRGRQPRLCLLQN